MKKILSFDQLSTAVNQLDKRLNKIEKLLSQKSNSKSKKSRFSQRKKTTRRGKTILKWLNRNKGSIKSVVELLKMLISLLFQHE